MRTYGSSQPTSAYLILYLFRLYHNVLTSLPQIYFALSLSLPLHPPQRLLSAHAVECIMCAVRALRLVSEMGTICRVELFFRSHGLAKARPSWSRGPDQHSGQAEGFKGDVRENHRDGQTIWIITACSINLGVRHFEKKNFE